MINECPFCGNTENGKNGPRLIQTNEIVAGLLGLGWRVKCPSCEALGPIGDYKCALGQWNCWREEAVKEFSCKSEDKNRIKVMSALCRLAVRANEAVFSDPGDACRWSEAINAYVEMDGEKR